MTDRESIVAMLRKQAKEAHALVKPCDVDGKLSMLSLAAAAETFADQIERGEDLIKPKPAIADLLTLHDLDLGALAHKVGVIGEDITTEHVEMLCDGFTADMGALTVLVRGAIMANDSPLASESAQNVAAQGAKVRAALSASTIKMATPRVLQSADEAPCGALLHDKGDGVLTLRRFDGTGWHVGDRGAYALDATQRGYSPWPWAQVRHLFRGDIEVIAEGLTEAECRHLSGLSAADAIAWCKVREEGRRG